MIEFLKIENFKAFQSQSFTIKPLTVLTGLNSTGKSSMIQALLLLRQSYVKHLSANLDLHLNGHLVKIGTAKAALFEAAGTEDLICFEINWTNGDWGKWCFEYDLVIDQLVPDKDATDFKYEMLQQSLFDEYNNNFYYLQAERISPQTYFEISNDDSIYEPVKLGTKGEYAAYFLYCYAAEKILPQLSHPNVKNFVRELGEEPQQSLDLIDQVEAWMSDISPGVELNLEPRPDLDLINLRYNYGDENLYRPTNIGFGVTYVLPILVAILSAKPGALIILENPESHLHPRGQSRIGQLMALAASCGIQIIVETHSDHILNGIRLMTRKQQINADDIAIHYFTRGKKDGKYQTEVISPKIYQDGGIDQWPDGFFDQAENDLMELL
jgi:predicted ATPase